jgi:hypothetical protein
MGQQPVDRTAHRAWDGRVRRLSARRYARLLAHARVIEADPHGPKVLRTPQGLVVKLFRRKRLLSSALWAPYALRFARNAVRLHALGIPSVHVRGVWHCPARRRHLVAYDFLPGVTLRELGTRAPWRACGAFIAVLHARGIYFRSLHAGNLVSLPGGGFGLIDVADLRFARRPLTMRRRLRNFRLLRTDPAAGADALDALCAGYLEATPHLRAPFAARLREAPCRPGQGS